MLCEFMYYLGGVVGMGVWFVSVMVVDVGGRGISMGCVIGVGGCGYGGMLVWFYGSIRVLMCRYYVSLCGWYGCMGCMCNGGSMVCVGGIGISMCDWCGLCDWCRWCGYVGI